MNLLERKDSRGPLIFEIFFPSSKPEHTPAPLLENLQVCAAAKQEILRR